MTYFEDTIRRNFVRFLVQKAIFCPISGEVLDMDTCVVILDADGDPAAVMSQSAWRKISDMAEQIGQPVLREGMTVDESTVRT